VKDDYPPLTPQRKQPDRVAQVIGFAFLGLVLAAGLAGVVALWKLVL
jgi:hypothetical protein